MSLQGESMGKVAMFKKLVFDERNERMKRAVAKAEAEHEAKARERHMGNTQEVKEFFDATKAFEKLLKDLSGAIDGGRLPPESIQRTINKLNKVSKSIDQLKAKLDENQTDDRMR